MLFDRVDELDVLSGSIKKIAGSVIRAARKSAIVSGQVVSLFYVMLQSKFYIFSGIQQACYGSAGPSMNLCISEMKLTVGITPGLVSGVESRGSGV